MVFCKAIDIDLVRKRDKPDTAMLLIVDSSADFLSVYHLTHSRLRMPQGSPCQGRGMPPGSLSRGFDMFLGVLTSLVLVI